MPAGRAARAIVVVIAIAIVIVGVGGDFSGGPVVRTPSFHCRGHGFDPWSGN